MKRLFEQIFRYTREYTSLQILGALCTVLYTVAIIGGPLVSRYLIDTVIPSRSQADLVRGLLLFGGVLLLQPVIGVLKDRIFLHITEGMTRDIRNTLFHRVLAARLSFFDRTQKGGIISRILNDSREAGMFVSNFFGVFLKNSVLLVLVTAAMFYLSSRITAVILLSLLIYLYANWRFSRRLSGMQQKVTQNYDDLTSKIEQMSSTIFTIKSQQMEPLVAADYDALLAESYRDNQKIGFLEILMQNFTTVLAVAALELLNSGIGFRKMVPIIERIVEYDALDPEDTGAKKTDRSAFLGDITLRNLTFHYPDRPLLFDGLDLTIPARQTTCLLGESGSGKSTLAYLLMGFYRPLEGEVRYGGQTLDALGVKAVRERTGYVSQHIEMMNRTIRENLCRNEEDADAMVEECRNLGLHERILRLPEGYDTKVSERMNLSGGERQRLALVRALLRKPDILILDEPTSALDRGSEEAVLQLLRRLRGKCTLLIITHRPALIGVSDQVVEMGNLPLRKQA